MLKIPFILFGLLFLIYLILPGPTSIDDFPALPNSTKSTLEGDTIQMPNISAYFSNNYREFSVPFYNQHFRQKTMLPFSPFRLNYPPEFAFIGIKDQTQATFLEESFYPLRDSLFIAGLEPFYKDGRVKYDGANKFIIGNQLLDTKVTLRYYPSHIIVRILVWFGIMAAIFFTWRIGKRIIFNA